jgi:Cyclic nucleotide-binding domain
MSILHILRNLPVDVVGYFAALLMIGAFAMRTMIPLRLWGIGASGVLVVFGYLSRSYPILILHLVLLPVNGLRLYQMLHFTRGIKEASRGDPDVNWLKPFMSSRQIARGAVLFRKGDPASELFYIVSGRFHISETDIERGPGALIGELGFLVPDDTRTATLECMDEAVVLRISYEQMKQLYFENPNFGFYLMRLASQRLLREIARLESEAAIRASAAATAAT